MHGSGGSTRKLKQSKHTSTKLHRNVFKIDLTNQPKYVSKKVLNQVSQILKTILRLTNKRINFLDDSLTK
ncbi:FAD binding domain-containing protein [Aphanothece sacrum FPU1]|uniref:FAD binding domain-containing protein n=1 Tax=Aphanothece sacrum FPU1 TaxID=1920663 RepID=A0A401IFF5_APHSA|nr:FAD binding domain-containing protein [Aphanothece sacrum FPU1]GBF83772.1 FAD binding domain-containing protein [Aphanothece sacrum FPU3]